MNIEFEFIKELFQKVLRNKDCIDTKHDEHGWSYFDIPTTEGVWGVVSDNRGTYLLLLDGEIMANMFIDDTKFILVCVRVPNNRFMYEVDLNLKSFNSKIKSQLRTIVKYRHQQAGS